MSREWKGEDLPFGTVIHAVPMGMMLIVGPPTRPGVRRDWSGLALGHEDHATIWLARAEDPTDSGGLSWLGTYSVEAEYHWQIIEDPA